MILIGELLPALSNFVYNAVHFISFISRAKHRCKTLTQDISRLKCYPNCCENKLTLVRLRVERIVPVKRRVNLPILAVGGDGPSPSSKSIRSLLSPVNPSNRLLRAPRSMSYLALPDSPMSTLVAMELDTNESAETRCFQSEIVYSSDSWNVYI